MARKPSATVRLVSKPRRKGVISVEHPGISTGVASTLIKNTRLTKIEVIIRRSTENVTDLKRKLLKVGQRVEARLLGQEELETEDQDLVGISTVTGALGLVPSTN